MTTKLDIVTIFVFRSHTTKARKCFIYHIPMLLNTFHMYITAKYTLIAKLGFVKYTEQLFYLFSPIILG